MAGLTTAVAEFTVSNDYDAIPEDVIDHAKRHLRDAIGIALAGSSIDLGDIAIEHVATTNAGDDATVIGSGTASPTGAAFANGVLAHALEWDDTPGGPHHLSHPSPPTLPAALAATELVGASGSEFLAGYVTGVEVLSRLELASFPDHYFHGWHDTGTYGVFGAATAAASILDVDVETTARTIAIAASCSSGLIRNNATMTKPFHAGHAAHDGLRAALLARDGLTADETILDGERGYLDVYSPGGYDPEPLETFGDEWHLLDYGYKPFPGITVNHGAQFALLELVEREDLTPEDVARITVTLHERADEILWNPDPEDPFEAIASIEFNLATILRERGHGLDQFSAEYVTTPETREQMKKVTRDVFDEAEDFDMFDARVAVETVDGEVFVEEKQYSPLDVSDEWLEEKFFDCAGAVLERSDARRIADAVVNLEVDGELDSLLAAVRTR